jgi:signal transduction histidine kinase
LQELPGERLPAAVEAAAHRLVADAVQCAERHGNGSTVVVAVAREDGLLRAHIRLPGVPHDRAVARMAHSADRVAALGGRLDVGPDDTIEARVPCGS